MAIFNSYVNVYQRVKPRTIPLPNHQRTTGPNEFQAWQDAPVSLQASVNHGVFFSRRGEGADKTYKKATKKQQNFPVRFT